jgi:hypothetical protein
MYAKLSYGIAFLIAVLLSEANMDLGVAALFLCIIFGVATGVIFGGVENYNEWLVSQFRGAPSPPPASPKPVPETVPDSITAASAAAAEAEEDEALAETPVGILGDLQRLAALHAEGHLSDVEFASAKRRLLDG